MINLSDTDLISIKDLIDINCEFIFPEVEIVNTIYVSLGLWNSLNEPEYIYFNKCIFPIIVNNKLQYKDVIVGYEER